MKLLKRILMLIVLFCGILLGSTEIVLGQQSIHPECGGIHYTDNQDKRALECLQNKIKRDSLLNNSKFKLENTILRLKEIKDREIVLNQNISQLNKSLANERKKLKFSLSLNKYGIPIALGGGLLVGMVLSK